MEQAQLRAWESLCIQEQPAWCVAACPLHVDARAFLARAANGDWAAARKILERTMPFPGILGRICDHPCQAVCKRGEAGGAVEIAAVERACVGLAGLQSKPLVLPQKSFRVAVLGAGLAGMTVAWDLARKGFAVALHCARDHVGGGLAERYAGRVPDEEFAAAAELLGRVKVDIKTGAALDKALLDSVLAGADAVFLDWGETLAADLGIGATPDPVTLQVGDRLFAGGGLEADGSFSPIRQAADGRRASSSMDRLLQGASLTAQRDHEGPVQTRLYTEISGIDHLPVVAMADGSAGYSADEARAEAGRCLQCECMECVKACTFMQEYKGYPKTFARQIYNNEAIVKGHHLANKLINSCYLCDQCRVICPNDFSMAELCLTARQSMVDREKMPPSAFDFALEDLRFSLSDHFALARRAPDGADTEYVFFPGCQLAASNPEQVEAVYAWLLEALGGKVGLMLGCCGAPAHWAGDKAFFARVLDGLRDGRAELGSPKLILACSTCFHTLAAHAPDMPRVSLWPLLGEAAELPAGAALPNDPVALHDPCTSRDFPDLQQGVRDLLGRLGVRVEELDRARELTSCCGFGGNASCANPPLARKAAEARAAESSRDYLTWCAMCRDMFARTGKRSSTLLDHLFPSGGRDPAARPSPGFSERMESRARLRQRMLERFWQEESVRHDDFENVALLVSDEVRGLLEERRILTRDIKRVILHAETTGNKLRDPRTGRFLAYHQPVRVTYWVEYEPEGEAFRVHKAYSHRMSVPGGQP